LGSEQRDELVSLPKSVLTDFIGHLSPEKLLELDRALAFALDLSSPQWIELSCLRPSSIPTAT